MSASLELEKKLSTGVASPIEDEADVTEVSSQIIYIDPEKEKAAFRKFDKYVVPVSFIFMLLCALDRNNVSGNPFLYNFRSKLKQTHSLAMHESLASTRISASVTVSSATSIPSPP